MSSGAILLLEVRVGPLAQHLALFSLLVIVTTVVYHGIRRESVSEILRVGLGKGVFYVLASLLVFGGGGFLLAQWL